MLDGSIDTDQSENIDNVIYYGFHCEIFMMIL